MPKKARLSGIKSFHCYTIDEAAGVSNVTHRTIRNWEADGLHVMNGARPALIRGDDLRDFIKSARAKRKVKTRIDTFYCVCCRGERRAAEGMVDCCQVNGRTKLTALCEECGTVVSKPISEASIPEIARIYELKIKRH